MAQIDITETTPRQDLSAFLQWASNRIAQEVKQNEIIQKKENQHLEEKIINANYNTNYETNK